MIKRTSVFWITLIISSWVHAEPVAIIGGSDGVGAYAAFVNSNTGIASSSLTGLPSAAGSSIRGVAINDYGQALVVGQSGFTQPYAAFVNQSANQVGTTISNLQSGGSAVLYAAALNDLNQGFIGGNTLASPRIAYSAFVEMNTNAAGANVANLPAPSANTSILGVAINNAKRSIVAGEDSDVPYAAYVNEATNAVESSVLNLPTVGSPLNAIAMNQSGLALTGGIDPLTNNAYAAFIPLNSNRASASIASLPSPGIIFAVALNDQGQGIVGGATAAAQAYAAFVDPVTNTASPISNLPTNAGSGIVGVAINNFGQALVGGFDGTKAYAAFVDPITKTASAPILSLPTAPGSIINAVALIMGSQIPINGLNGNNLNFADYINKNSSQNAFYFIPAYLNGSLAEALESAAPTRNAISLFTVDNNMFHLNHSLSYHLRNHRHFKSRKEESPPPPQRETSIQDFAPTDRVEMPSLNELLSASQEVVSSQTRRGALASSAHDEKRSPFSLWTDIIGALGSQDAQHQTAGFAPSLVGFILGFDGDVGEETEVGGGAAYTSTHIDEDRDSGYSDIEQGYLFTYATWSRGSFYLDGALWAGFFKIYQERDIHIAGWNFQSISRPGGYQLSPHLEFGYDYTFVPPCCLARFKGWILDPFVMLDWVNAWQGRYEEVGPSPFNAGQKAHYSSFLRSEAGFRFYEQFAFCLWRLILEEKLSYVNKSPFGVGKVNAYLVGSPGSFTVETLTSLQNLVAVEMGVIFEPTNHSYPYGSISYQGEFNGSSQLHQISAELSLDF